MNPFDRMGNRKPNISLGECQAALADAQQGAAELQDKYLRATAALANVRKQAERDTALRIAERVRGFSARMIEVADNLERALAHTTADDALYPGVRATLQQLQAALRQEGVEVIPVSQGALFDPAYHEAISGYAADVAHDTIAEVVQAGYTLDGQLLRPTRVVVAHPPRDGT